MKAKDLIKQLKEHEDAEIVAIGVEHNYNDWDYSKTVGIYYNEKDKAFIIEGLI